VRRLRFRLLPLLAAMVTLAAVTVVQAGPASANESAPTLSPAQGPVGTRVTAAASDWIGCTSMSVSGWGSTLATTTINSSGAFSLSFTIPASAPGDQQLQFSPTCSHSTLMPFVTFTVTAGSTDTSAPSVSWTSPVGNSGTFPVSSGSVTLQASASDNVGVARVKFTRWDAVAVKWVDLATVSSAPWQTALAVSTLNSGYNQVNVQAWDAAGNASTSPYIWLNRSTPDSVRLSVPFATQMGTAGDINSGGNNCGPASVTMAMRFFGGSVSVQDSAVAIRGFNTNSNGPTDFKSPNAMSWLARYGLTEKTVTTLDQIRAEIAAGRPVIILVNNNQYRYSNPRPYVNNNNGWFTNAHIVVVTGYDSANVYINDPLRSAPDYAISVPTFQSAASTTPSSSPSSWYAASILRG